jgi:molecular chaperone IbpA
MNKALNLIDNFNQLTPYAVGFDRIINDLQRYTENTVTSSGFPPYNIRKETDYTYLIEMALAGFGRDDLEIETSQGTIAVRSVKEPDFTVKDDQIYRGIAYRKFERKFTIADDIIVKNASLVNGMLTIKLERVIPEEKKPKLIAIN